MQAQLHPNKPDLEPPFPPKTIKWAIIFVNQPSQYELNKPDDYTRILKQQYEKTDVPQFRQQAKQSIPLEVFSEVVPPELNMDEIVLLAAQMGVTVADLLGGADLPKAVVA
jgi:hypothetical protein